MLHDDRSKVLHYLYFVSDIDFSVNVVNDKIRTSKTAKLLSTANKKTLNGTLKSSAFFSGYLGAAIVVFCYHDTPVDLACWSSALLVHTVLVYTRISLARASKRWNKVHVVACPPRKQSMTRVKHFE